MFLKCVLPSSLVHLLVSPHSSFSCTIILFDEIVKFYLLGLIVSALDPLGIRRIFDNVTNNVFGTIPYILAATPYFILSLYW